jgi:uncharacterized protein YceH (UPF0502 family)
MPYPYPVNGVAGMNDQQSQSPAPESCEVEQLRGKVKAQSQQIAEMRERLDALLSKTDLKNLAGDESKN